MDITDLKPGMKRVNLIVEIIDASELKRVVKSAGIEHEILELEVADTSGSIKLVLWDEKIISNLEMSDRLKIENGFVTSFKGILRINVGKYGDARKV